MTLFSPQTTPEDLIGLLDVRARNLNHNASSESMQRTCLSCLLSHGNFGFCNRGL